MKAKKQFIMVIEGSGSCCDHGLGNQTSEMFKAESWDKAIEKAAKAWEEYFGDNRIEKITLADVREVREFDTDPGEDKEAAQLRKLKNRVEKLENELCQKTNTLSGLVSGLEQASGVDLSKAFLPRDNGISASCADIASNIIAEAVRKAKARA